MNRTIKGSVTFRCSQCQTRHRIDAQEFHFAPEAFSSETIEHEERLSASHTLTCGSCGQSISLHATAWVTPEGKINRSEIAPTGADSVKGQFHLAQSTGTDTESQNRIIGSAAGGAILGASLGGPFGALLGGAIGALLGDSVNKSRKGKNDG